MLKRIPDPRAKGIELIPTGDDAVVTESGWRVKSYRGSDDEWYEHAKRNSESRWYILEV